MKTETTQDPHEQDSYIWAETVMERIAKQVDSEFKKKGKDAFYGLQNLFSEIILHEIDVLRNEVRKEFYGDSFNKGISDIIQTVCTYYHMQPEDLSERTRRREYVELRQLFCWLVKVGCIPNRLTLTQIGEFCGRVDHATVLYYIKTVNNRISTEQKFREDVMQILNDYGWRCQFDGKKIEFWKANP